MGSIVRLGPGKSGGPLGITSHGLDHTILTPQMRSLKFKSGDIVRVGGPNDGALITDGEVPANARVTIHLSTPVNPRRYEVLIGYNPELLKSGSVSCPNIIGPGRGDEIALHFHAGKKVNIRELDYIFELFMID